MKLSTRGKYGLYAMVYLAEHQAEGPKSLKEIASLGMPENYLEQLLGALRRNDLVCSIRGAQGGYMLKKSPDEITVLDIIDAMEGPVSFSDCLDNKHVQECPRCNGCKTRHVWEHLTNEINSLLSGITLSTMLNAK